MNMFKSLSMVFILAFCILLGGHAFAQDILCGDTNDDGTINIMDIIYIINYLLIMGPAPIDMDASDVDQIPDITLNDAMAIRDIFMYSAPVDCQIVPDTSLEISDDSIIVSGGLVPAGVRDCEVRLSVKTAEHIYGISLPLLFSCSTSEVECDSVTFPSDLSGKFDIRKGIIDNTEHTVLTALGSVVSGGLTGPGEFHVASLWFHINTINPTGDQTIGFDTTQILPSNIVIITKNQPNHEAAIPTIEYQPDIVFNEDSDDDGIFDAYDNCPNVSNPDQANNDNDNYGNLCDNCPDTPGEDLTDADADDIGDICDACPNDADNDADGDTICGDVDNCPAVANTDQADSNGNGIGDACDAPVDWSCGDTNADGWINIGDVIYLINFIFKSGSPPCQPEQ